MSYSSIEVMSENAVQMVLMGPEDSCSEKEPDFHTLAPVDPNSSSVENMAENAEEQEIGAEFQEEIAPMGGAIIFSPQDMMTSNRSNRGRGRGRSKGVRRPDALTIKIEEGVDYSRIDVPVACEICGKVVANGKTLVQHMSTHSDVKPFQCPHCPKSFARMVHLQGHLVFHGIEKQFECPTCHQRFSRQDCVKVHMRLHDKSKCVFCKVCHKAFLTLGALNIHMRIHRGEKPFKCHLCGKCFTQKNHVITHIKRHTKVSSAPFSKKLGPRMFQCEHCPRSFIRMSDYERHVQWNHGAVTDTGLSDRLPTFGNVSPEERSSGILMLPSRFPSTGDITMNNRVRKKSIRKVMCTTGTQTDQEGGHVIIPRQYQNAASMTTTSTQVSAPPTPRPTDDELYENDIFDEGMDRNYSSDEDDLEGEDAEGDHEGPTYQESETTMVSFIRDGASTSATDDAFDAIIGKAKPDLIKREVVRDDPVLDSSPCEDRVIQSELAAEYAKREESLLAPQTPVSEPALSVNSPEKPPSFCSQLGLKSEEANSEEVEEEEEEDEGRKITPPKSQPNTPSQQSQSVSSPSSQPMPPPARPPRFHPNMPRPTTKILDNFNTKNWRGRGRARGRGRGRGRSKSFMGLTGATHLRLIRKSMINFISEKNEQINCTEKPDEAEFSEESHSKVEEEQFADAETTSLDKRVKRQSKVRQHGKDFVCDVKSCETCNPVKEDLDPLAPEVQPIQQVKRTITTTSQPTNQPSSVKDQSAKLLQFLISGDESNLQGTDFKIISDVKETQLEAKRMKLDEMSSLKSRQFGGSADTSGSFSSFTGMKSEKTDFFTPVTSSQDDFISPPVELQAFCIPTYSCKLCGREFRFEGKLHRHIESVHQKKAIFSPDVKPGRVSRDLLREYSTILEKELPSISPPPVSIKKTVPKNPEIEALRSEWDDDDDNDDEEDEASHQYEEERTITQITREPLDSSTISAFKEATFMNARPSVTKDMVSMSDSVSDIYVSGVKVNINKISGLAGSDLIEYSKRRQDNEGLSSQLTSAKPQVKPPSSLEIKCRKLLEKLFDHTLLIECGLFQEHVSVVLGRLLQHYGVKNIEDYGQGQYEVLKYNLWRLIEWKVTMEQMEEFYTDGKSVEEMMDDIMNGRVPIIAHHELHQEQPVEEPEPEPPQPQNEAQPIQAMEAVHLSEGQLMLSQVTNVLGGQLNLGEGVTQVVLAQDVSPEMLQGAHIVTIDPTTGQVLSQVTADQVILADSLGDDINHQIQSMDGHVVVSHSSPAPTVVSALPPGSILASSSDASHISASMHSDQMVNATGTIIKMEAVPHSTHSSL